MIVTSTVSHLQQSRTHVPPSSAQANLFTKQGSRVSPCMNHTRSLRCPTGHHSKQSAAASAAQSLTFRTKTLQLMLNLPRNSSSDPFPDPYDLDASHTSMAQGFIQDIMHRLLASPFPKLESLQVHSPSFAQQAAIDFNISSMAPTRSIANCPSGT